MWCNYIRIVVVAMGLVVCGAATVQAEWETAITTPEGIALPDKISVKDTMNFVDCVQPKRSVCMLSCGLPGIRASYREPTVVVEVTCRTGESALMNNDPLGKAVGSVLTKAVTQGKGETKCQVSQSGNGNQSAQTQNFFNAHAFGVTPGAMFHAAAGNAKKARAATDIFICEVFMMLGKYKGDWGSALTNTMKSLTGSIMSGTLTPATALSTADDFAGTVSSLGRMCGADILTANLTASLLPAGLIPAFISELCFPATWAMMNPANMKDQVRVAATLATIDTSGVACSLSSVYNDVLIGTGDWTGFDLDKFVIDLGDNSPCVGTWGNRSPTTGWHANKIRPISAAMVGYRAYQEVANLVPKYKNRKGTLRFNMDYPFINGTGIVPSINPFKPKHGHKGSGCYNVGTMDPRWYTAGESFIPDPSAVMDDTLKSLKDSAGAAVGKAVKTNNGDFVFTMWRNNSCCYGVCPTPKPPFVRPDAKKEFN